MLKRKEVNEIVIDIEAGSTDYAIAKKHNRSPHTVADIRKDYIKIKEKKEEATQDELDKRYEPKHKEREIIEVKKSNNTGKNIGIVILIIALVIGLLFSEDIQNAYTDYSEEEVSPEVLTSADLQLYKFSDLTSNTSVNVELWLINIGETTATDIEIYIRVRNQNGTILLSDEISPTILVLRDNETCSAIYSIPIESGDTTIMHTIEIEWSEGRTSYHKETTL